MCLSLFAPLLSFVMILSLLYLALLEQAATESAESHSLNHQSTQTSKSMLHAKPDNNIGFEISQRAIVLNLVWNLSKGHNNNLPTQTVVLHHGNWKEYQRATTGADSVIPLLASKYIYTSVLAKGFFSFFPPEGLLKCACACRKHYLFADTDDTTVLLQSLLLQKVGKPRRITSHLRCGAQSKPLELGRAYLEQP